MGALLQSTALSPNIKDRLDFSCAVFGASRELHTQTAHIPVLAWQAVLIKCDYGGLL